jgi:hypothetical protein
MVKETPRDDFTTDDLPGWTPEEVEKLQHIPRHERLAMRLPVRKEKTDRYPDGMSRPDGSKQGDRDE